jgi:hypothetical protein
VGFGLGIPCSPYVCARRMFYNDEYTRNLRRVKGNLNPAERQAPDPTFYDASARGRGNRATERREVFYSPYGVP